MLRSPTSLPVSLLLAATVATALASPAQAGLLDALFGVGSPPPRLYEPETDPLNVTVRKKARKTAAPQTERPPILQKSTLDPSKDPHWYLKDETLRRGDIVVLPNRVLILRDGGGSLRPAAFEDIKRTTSLSERERARIIAITEFRAGIVPKYKIIAEPTNAPNTISQLDRSSIPMIMP